MPDGLNGINEKRYPVFTGDLADGLNGLDGADLIAGMDGRDQDRFIRYSLLDVPGVDQPLFIYPNIRDLKAIFLQLFDRLVHRMMLYGGDNDMIALMFVG